MKVIPFQPEHLRLVAVQPAQRSEMRAEQFDTAFGQAWTAVAGGVPIGCGGLVEVWVGRAYAWALVGVDAGPHMRSLTREIRSRIAASGFRRVEMAVDAEFDAGRRWAELLGFRCETPEPMRSYLPNGRAAYLYART